MNNTSTKKIASRILLSTLFFGLASTQLSAGAHSESEAGQSKAQFEIIKLTLSSKPENYSGKCPVKLTLNGEFISNRAGTLEYQWKSGDSLSRPKEIKFNSAQKRKVQIKFNVSESQNVTYSLVSNAAGVQSSNSVQVDINCNNN